MTPTENKPDTIDYHNQPITEPENKAMSDLDTVGTEWDPSSFAEQIQTELDRNPDLPVFTSVEQWVNQWLIKTMQPRIRNDFRWCPKWWAHPEALARLVALWGAWEEAETSQELSARSNWWAYHFASHWPEITSPTGPFSACTPQRHVPGSSLPTEPIPLNVELVTHND